MLIFRWLIIIGITSLAIIGISPSIDYYNNYHNQEIDTFNIEKVNEIKNNSLTLGLDLQGGTHMVLEINLVDLFKSLADRDIQKNIRLSEKLEKILVKAKLESLENNFNFLDAVFAVAEKRNEDLSSYYFKLSKNPDKLYDILQEKIKQAHFSSAEVIRKRVDAFGVSEPLIQTKGLNQIIVELAGVKDEGRAERLIQNTGKLEFKTVRILDDYLDIVEVIDSIINKQSNSSIKSIFQDAGRHKMVSNFDTSYVRILLQKTEIQKILNENKSQFLWGRAEGDFTPLYLLNRTASLTGNMIQNPKADQYPLSHRLSQQWYISLAVKDAKLFENLTERNINKSLAIILDNQVQMAPNIQSRIPSGQATISGNFTKHEAKDIETILIAGELPAQITILSQLQIDASLGKDSINSGFKAIQIALASVLFFMIIYYKGCGILASIAMLLNLLFILSFLSNPWINATLTLPGIAGLILTVGIAIDANVIIFERIREEIYKGAKPFNAIEHGYRQALSTILDSNLTTLIAAMCLYILGTGQIKGFSVTLSVGILCSMFTAIFVTRTILDTILKYTSIKKISI